MLLLYEIYFVCSWIPDFLRLVEQKGDVWISKSGQGHPRMRRFAAGFVITHLGRFRRRRASRRTFRHRKGPSLCLRGCLEIRRFVLLLPKSTAGLSEAIFSVNATRSPG